MRGADMRVRWIWAWLGAGTLGAVAAPAASAALFSQELASFSESADRLQAKFTKAPGAKAADGWPARPFSAAEVVTGTPAWALGHAEAAGMIELWSQYAFGAAQQSEEAGGGHRADLSPLTAEDMVLDLVRYRVAGTLATAAGPLALWNGAAVVAEFSPGPNDSYEPSRWQWGRCRTGLSRC